MLTSQRRVLNMSPSSRSSSRRMTLSRVVLLPSNSMRRTKNCLPSSTARFKSILGGSSSSRNSKLGSATKSM